VLYSSDRGLLTGARIGSSVPQGKAKLGTVDANAIVTVSFIFPHSDHPSPNTLDQNEKSLRSGSTVFYKVIKKKGTAQFESDIIQFTMPDKLTLANFGDSYAAGEGAPYSSGAKWDNARCHRSGNSGHARAVKQFKRDHPETAIAFKNVACSGAGVQEGIIQSQLKKPFLSNELHATQLVPQIDQVKAWLDANRYEELNIALISIGINEIGFAEAVEDFFIKLGNITTDTTAQNNIQNNINQLSSDYSALKNAFDAAFVYDRVLVSEYPDLTHWRNGQFCGRSNDLSGYGLCWGGVEITSGDAEFKYAFEQVLSKMNAKIKSLVVTYQKWGYVEGAAAGSRLHGLCNCENPFFNTIGASMLEQSTLEEPFNVNGTFHPNRDGHRTFCKPVELAAITDAVKGIRKAHAIERAKEIAKEKALAKARLKPLPALVIARKIIPKTAAAKAGIPADILKKAQAASAKATRAAVGDDNRMMDDNE
jgi:hypothetical protein